MGKKLGYYSNIFTKINNTILKNKALRGIKNLYYYIDAILMLLFTKKPKKENSEKKKIVIVYNLSLGDGAIFITSLKNIREIYPNDKFEITLFCQKGFNKMYEKINVFDEVIPLDFIGSTVNLKNRIETIRKLRNKYYDIALDPFRNRRMYNKCFNE